MGSAPAGLVRRRDGIALLASGLPIAFFNQVLIENDRATAEALGAAIANIGQRGQPYMVLLRRGTDDEFVRVVQALGLVLPPGEAPLPGMALHPIRPSSTIIPAGHEI